MLRSVIRLSEDSRYYQVSARTTGFPVSSYTYALQRTIPSVRRTFTSPLFHRNICKYMNINMFTIDYAFRLRLRTRLTLIRLALIRKPWSFGVQVSHLHYRYLCLHLLFQTLQHDFHHTFNADWNAPLPLRINSEFTASVICFMPAYYPRPIARLVSCYALFK